LASNLKNSELCFLEEEDPGSADFKTKSSYRIKRIPEIASNEDAKFKVKDQTILQTNPLVEASKLPPLQKNTKRKLKPIRMNQSKGEQDVTTSNYLIDGDERTQSTTKGLFFFSSPISKLQQSHPMQGP
jgi:hypothetical protein